MAASRQLSTTQRVAIRAIHDGRPEEVAARTMRVLEDRHMVNDRGELTMLGVNTYHRIMESGDGPEDLKAMLQFGATR